MTFAFTDIEGSTVRWERDRDAMRDAVRRHDALLRAAISAHDGYVFKTIGDAFCAAFSRPEDAVAAMLGAQRALAAEDFSAVDGIRVRAAIHTGTTDERENDYFGPAVNRVARLLAIGHGGQILVSGASARLVAGLLPAQTTLRDLGEHRLRDLILPEHVYQLAGPDEPATLAALKSLGALPNNLPQTANALIGREREIAEITALVREHRIVTLSGSGGIGKTRTALQVAANLLEGFADGVWLIELAPLAAGDYIASTVARDVGIALPGDGDRLAHLVRALASKHMLLVFDNCEHLIDPAARVAAALLHGCPQVRVLATSRQRLGIRGEQTYRVPALSLPGAADREGETAPEVARYSAIALFVERARAVDSRFELTGATAPIVVDICRRLDGLPLAIELAAARVRILTPRQLRERLNERFRLLTGGHRDAVPRQQTIRALIDWSYDLLDERERTVFRRLGIFINGTSVEGVTAVGGGEDIDEFDVVDLLASLVDQSLVLAEPAGDTIRYRLLESTRIYAAEKLAATREHAAIAGRHLRYLRDVFCDLRAASNRTAREVGMADRFAVELDDVRAALADGIAQHDVRAGAELLAALDIEWVSLGLDHEGIRCIETYLAALPADATLSRARLLRVFADLLSCSSFWERGVGAAQDALACARESGDEAVLTDALVSFALRVTESEERERSAEIEAALDEAEAIARPTLAMRPAFHNRLLGARAGLNQFQGNFETAERLCDELRTKYLALGRAQAAQNWANQLAWVANLRGEPRRSIAVVAEILPAVRAGRDKQFLIRVLTESKDYLLEVGDFDGAEARANEALAQIEQVDPDHGFAASSFEVLALAAATRGELERAATLWGYVDERRMHLETPYHSAFETRRHARLVQLLEQLAPDERKRCEARGAALTPKTAIAFARSDAAR